MRRLRRKNGHERNYNISSPVWMLMFHLETNLMEQQFSITSHILELLTCDEIVRLTYSEGIPGVLHGTHCSLSLTKKFHSVAVRVCLFHRKWYLCWNSVFLHYVTLIYIPKDTSQQWAILF